MSKYLDVKHILTEQLNSGKYAPNQRMPTDREFYKELGVNRLTVIKALKALEEEGRIVRRRGSGTYVADAPPLIAGRKLNLAFLHRVKVHKDFLDMGIYGSIAQGALSMCNMTEKPTEFSPPQFKTVRGEFNGEIQVAISTYTVLVNRLAARHVIHL